MLSFLAGMLLSVVVALLFLRRIDPSATRERLAGEALILGPALPAVPLFLSSLLSIPWSRGLLFSCGAIALVALLVRRPGRHERARVDRVDEGSPNEALLAALVALLVLLLLAGYAQFSYVTAGAENDFIGIWGGKGRTFFEFDGVDWGFLSAHWRGYAHPDYPLLVPLMFSGVAVVSGAWSESMIGLVYPVLALGGVMLALSELRRRTSRTALQWLGVLAVVPFVMSPWIGLADGPLAMMVMASLLRLARWIDEPSRAHLAIGAVFLGFAMSTKNEGLTLGFVAVVATVALTPRARRSDLVRLWPAAVIALPWLVLRSVHRLSTDLFEGGVVERLAGRVFDAGYVAALGRYLVEFRPGQWLVYLLFIGTIVVSWRRTSLGQRMIAAVISAQLVIDMVAYLITPLPLEWHVRWSWERLVSQVGAVLAVTVVSILVDLVEGRSGGGRLTTLVGAGPEVENQEPDSNADR